jgi:hypothetical protein
MNKYGMRRKVQLLLVTGWSLLAASVTLWAGEPGGTAPPAPSPSGSGSAAISGELAPLVEALNSDRFDVRRRAAEQLERLVEQPPLQPALVAEFERLRLRAETPFEVRSIVESILARLPRENQEQPTEVVATGAELDQLLSQADGPSYSLRLGAAARLDWLAENPKNAWEIIARLKQRLADPGLSSETRKRLIGICEKARGTWLATDPASWPAPRASDEQLAGWVSDLALPGANETAALVARQELLDLLAHDGQIARVRAALEQRQAKGIVDRGAAERVEELLEWTKPAMVAEIWSNHQQNALQYLLVDVPQRPEGAPRATHFDRIDDHTAHCVSGNSLAPGDYPVDVALPPTNPDPNISREGVLFHLVNLPTPRRRLLFELGRLKIDEAKRLTELSEKTTAWMLAQKRPLSEREVAMLAQLDASVVSRFVGPYLRAVDDVPSPDGVDDDFPLHLAGRTSRHAMLCYVLAEVGTRDAGPGLVEAIRKRRFLPPSLDAPYQLSWIAALSIARRDPWADCDTWLASLVVRTEALVTIGPESAELGATAAALLLSRHGGQPAEFGLEEVANDQMLELGCQGYRFSSSEKRGDVLRWWAERKARLAQRGPA